MDRRPLILLALAACASAPATVDIGSRGAIGYHAELLGSRLLLSVELGLRFELVIRRIDPTRLVDIGRVDLGPPDWDVTALAAPAVGPRVWIGSMDGTVREIDVGRRRIERTWRAGQAVTAVAISSDGRYLAYGTDRGVVCLRRSRDGALLQCMRAHAGRVSALAIGAGELVSATWDGAVSRFAVPSLRRLGAFEIDGAVNDVALRGDRAALAVSSRPPVGDRRRNDLGGSVVTIDLAGGERRRCRGHRGAVTAVDWTAEGDLVSGSWDRTVRLWRIESSRCRERWRHSLAGHQITGLDSGPDGRHLAVSLWVTTLEQPGSLLLRSRIRAKADR